QIIRVAHLIGCNQIWTERAESVACLSEQPLLCAQLQIAGGQVIYVAISEYVVKCIFFCNIFGFFTDNDNQLRLIVHFASNSNRQRNVMTVSSQRIVEFVEQNRKLRNWGIRFFRVLAIVKSDANDFVRMRDTRTVSKISLIQDEASAGSQHLVY